MTAGLILSAVLLFASSLCVLEGFVPGGSVALLSGGITGFAIWATVLS